MDLTNLNKDRKRKPSLDLGNMVFGKVPPQSKELEMAVLGAIMIESRALDIVIEILKPETFYVEAHQRIYRAILSLYGDNMTVDELTISQRLLKTGELDLVGGGYYLIELTKRVVSSANIESHALLLKEKFIKRELIRMGGEIVQESYEDESDFKELLDEADRKITNLISGNDDKTISTIGQCATRVMVNVETRRHNKSEVTGVPTGWDSLNKVTRGWQNTDLIILAARPSVGKSAFAINIATNSAAAFLREWQVEKTGMSKSVMFFSLEMSKDQVTERAISAETEIWLEKIQKGALDEGEMKHLYKKGMQRFNELPIFIDDTAALNIFELRAKCRRLKNKHNLGIIVIDYLQLMSGVSRNRTENREQEISRISRDLKILAKELNVPIIALSQLSREVEKRKEGKQIPQLSDLRESGAIEQDADMVMFLYRPEYYDITANEMGESNKGQTDLKIAKHRNGSLDTVKFKALLHIQKFIEDDGTSDFTSKQFPGTNFRPIRDEEKEAPF